MCRYATGDRLRLIYGLVTDNSSSKALLAGAEHVTTKLLASAPNRVKTRYICLNDASDTSQIPRLSIDRIMADRSFSKTPTLIKCDVEGAEMFVLSGAREFLCSARPDLLISIHPSALLEYGQSSSNVYGLYRLSATT